MTSPGSDSRRITVTAAVLEKDGMVLIARRKRGDRLADKWEFPGGKLEKGETPESCLRRELQEELGIELLAYRVIYLSGDFQLHDHEEIRWVSPADLASHDFSAADIPIVKLLIEGM
jgi:8-oxo-dGTP diphosphatase